MFVVEVDVQVTPESVPAFEDAVSRNAQASRREPGVVRFDVFQDRDDPGHFVLVEVYRDEAAVLAHKETAHYAAWRDAVAPMMARPRTSRKLRNVSPADVDY